MCQQTEHHRLTRREALIQTGLGLGVTFLAGSVVYGGEQSPAQPELFRYCLNTATIGIGKRPLPDTIAIAAKAGYSAVEPWISDIQQFV